ncbi:hypothetical protein CR516_14440, partial [Enterococcus faecium]
MNISRSYLGDLENNRRNPSIETIFSLANALNIDIIHFFISPNSIFPSLFFLSLFSYLHTHPYLIFLFIFYYTHYFNFFFL